MKDELYEAISCILCGGSDYKVIYPAAGALTKEEIINTFKSSGDEPLTGQLVQCTQCKLQYVNPRLKGSVVVSGYAEGSDEKFVSQEKGRFLTFTRCLKNIEKFCEPGKVLDIGTAGGTFLAAAEARGWKSIGVEPNKWLASWGKNKYHVDVLTGTMEQQKFKDNEFAVVTLWDVLEHVPDPNKTLAEVARVVQKNGFVVINYPDIGSWIARAMGKRWVFLLNVHLFYFTPETIRQLLEKNGFEVMCIKPHFQTLGFGYLCYRLHAYNRTLSFIMQKIVRHCFMENIQIPYWLGQTFILAKKR